MDRFIKITSEKKISEKPLNEKYRSRLYELVCQKKNVFVSGPPGVGKTTVVKDVLQNFKHFEMCCENIRFKDFLDNNETHIFIDDYDYEINLYKKMVDDISNGIKKHDGAFIVICEKYYMYPNFENIVIEKPTVSELLSLIPVGTEYMYAQAANDANGNIHNFLMYKDFPDTKDIFLSTKDYIIQLLCEIKYESSIKDTLQEHGSFWDMVHENYIFSDGTNLAKVINGLSLADAYDTRIYDGDWGSMKFFVNEVVRNTRLYLGKPLKPEDIKAGSCWSKNGNYKMRHHRLQNIIKKGPTNMNRECIYLLQKYAKVGDINKLLTYNVDATDFDIINHLCVGNKLKPRDVNNIKKELKNVINRG
uniref:Uncharacterized protein n=1 Tax=viral metagenome TaxID=1070528 RepID=A0A6C0JTS7_9ZZZZ